jgi:hypothetical protein
MEDKDKIKLEQVPYCPLCGAKGSIILENCFDPPSFTWDMDLLAMFPM